jgi:hypothetical protein
MGRIVGAGHNPGWHPFRMRPPPMPADPHLTARIARLFVYPVKSCAGVELREAVLTETGLDLDRAWMVVDAQGEFVTQRELPRMALVRPTLKLHEVVLRAPGMLALHLAIDTVEEPVRCGSGTTRCPPSTWATSRPSGSPISSAALRLVRFDPDHRACPA